MTTDRRPTDRPTANKEATKIHAATHAASGVCGALLWRCCVAVLLCCGGDAAFGGCGGGVAMSLCVGRWSQLFVAADESLSMLVVVMAIVSVVQCSVRGRSQGAVGVHESGYLGRACDPG